MWLSALACARSPNVEQPLDVLRRAGLEAGIFRHHVVEADQLVVDVEVVVERGRARLVGVDDRQHVADAAPGVLRQLGNAADDEHVVGQGHALFYSKARGQVQADGQHAEDEELAERLGRQPAAGVLARATRPTMVGATAATPPAMLVR